jgi:hypothetical protein
MDDQNSLAEGTAKAQGTCWTLRGKEAIGGWRHVRRAARGIKEDNPAAFFMFRTNGMPRAQGCARAACVNLALLYQERYAAGAGMRTTAGTQQVILLYD